MLTIHMPDDKDKRKRQRRYALGYVTAGILIIAATLAAWSSNLWFLPVVLEVWWFWAITDHDWEK